MDILAQKTVSANALLFLKCSKSKNWFTKSILSNCSPTFFIYLSIPNMTLVRKWNRYYCVPTNNSSSSLTHMSTLISPLFIVATQALNFHQTFHQILRCESILTDLLLECDWIILIKSNENSVSTPLMWWFLESLQKGGSTFFNTVFSLKLNPVTHGKMHLLVFSVYRK